MAPLPFTSGGLPEYHPGRLIVKMARASNEPLRALADNMERGVAALFTSAENPGLSILQRLGRAGLIRRAIPLSHRLRLAGADAGPGKAVATLAATTAPEAAEDANSRVNLLEVESDEAMRTLQEALAADPLVEYVSRVPVRYPCVPARRKKAARPVPEAMSPAASAPPAPAVPAAAEPDPAGIWNLAAIRWAQARQAQGFVDASAIRVAVLDTGIDSSHPDLGSVANYVYAHPQSPDASSDKDYIGHGTHVAGTIMARIGNQLGIDGITPCQLYVWKIFTDKPIYDSYHDSYIYVVDTVMYHRALADCLDEGIQVINLSIGGRGAPDTNEMTLFQQLMAAGTCIVAAMGNERAYSSPTSWPAAIPGVIAVGATRITDEVASFSNRGPHISLCAPGDTIWSTLPTYPGQTGFEAQHLPDGGVESGAALARDTQYAAWSGTSMAAPHVTAAVALLLAGKRPKPEEVRAALMGAADRVPGMGNLAFHQDYGAGRLNLERLLS